ncbi:MAG: hypothetical protein Q7T82_10465 [Armatimonadota bacterium]|nr:hypothetical protein [Armatimonadota bacterium]
MRAACVIVLCLISLPAFAKIEGKKFIEYGWDCPDTAYVRQHVADMEKIPFDGLVIRVMTPKGGGSTDSLGWKVWAKEKFKPEDYAQAVADLKATKFKRLKSNFIQVISAPGNIDWFDPEWPTVAHNAAALARVAKLSGCKGIMFDPEEYMVPVWSFLNMPEKQRAGHSFEDYQAKVRERGREFIRAINKEYPNITILALYGPSMTHIFAKDKPLRDAYYSLLASFYDGVCEAATSKTTLVDGYEFSYGYLTPQQFKDGRKAVLDAVDKSTNPDALRKHLRVGFGVWADWNSGQIGWHPEDLTKNYFSPAALRTSLNYALDTCDRYVWVYSERFQWWQGSAPKEFIEALGLSKTGPAPAE